jgi:hypothetical protein
MRKLMLLLVATMSMVSVAQQTRPDVEYFARPGCTSHKSLIKVREEFRDKVLQSAGEL